MSKKRLPDTEPEISYNELGQKVIKYQSHGLNIIGTIINEPSDEAIRAANRVYNKYFYKFNPQPLPENKDSEGGQ